MQAQEEFMAIKGKGHAATSSSSTTAEFGVSGESSNPMILSPSYSGDHAPSAVEEEEDMANCLILLANGSLQTAAPATAAGGEVYQCKTCDKTFSSFQALGGHRASHKKINSRPVSAGDEKRPPAMRERLQDEFRLEGRDESVLNLSLQIPSKSRVHECAICGAEFASGQALGGHMRRHRPILPAAAGSGGGVEAREVKRPRNSLSLDLNLPAPEADVDPDKFPFTAKEQVLVFSASPLVDCHY